MADVAAVLAHLEKALAGHPGADAALALAETLAARVAGGEADLGHRRLDLLRAAHAAESRAGAARAPRPPAGGDAGGARRRPRRRGGARERAGRSDVGRLDGAGLARRSSSPGSSRLDDGERVRAERVRLLRSLGRSRELSAALEKDAGALQGDARLAVLAEHATLLEGAGEAEKALDVRLMALAEFPGAPTVLDDARRRLDATGRAGESLALAIAALDHTTDPRLARRRQLLRDVASLTENAAGVDRTGAAEAWLAVLEVDPADAQAAAAAERFLVATGDWERCADLLAWLAARAPTLPPAPPRAARPAGPRCSGGWRSCGARASDRSTRRCGSTSSSAPPPSRRCRRWRIRRRWRRSCGASRCWRWRRRARRWRRRPPIDRARCSIARAPSRSAAGVTTPSATRWRRSTSIRATWRRWPRSRSSSRSRRARVCWSTSWGAGPPSWSRRRRRPSSTAGAGPRRARGTAAPRARPTGARCRSIRRWPSRSRRSARWPRRRGTGRRSPSCSRARWG